ncbi:adenylate/guanylate cyclase domain-containing protein [Magnetospira sp. QH-2]|uniref:adenylate/guanylate cyclase domain-containing protein n=1 Tax=Magnetospira sp. (strain QH-2) TaxID=1288970 RepID=UPI0003E81091|nr:adenylate/guanylate cyclase domain-containing protein [Magnetospira sp. QH-2]CCQ74913.1 putative Adenylate cyclase, family 3 [Magnetospira sp. QH-2]
MRARLAQFLFGDPPQGQLPERVCRAIERQQHGSEILIAWVQLTIITFFGVLYAIAPKGFMNTEFAPVPWAIGAFFAFSVVRLALIHNGFSGRGISLVGVVVDILLLMALIWVFHIQYMQPAPFYLKAPTLLYAFIFITLRALRFDPLFVVVGGVTAALGWAGLVIYAIGDSADGMGVITRNFVEYTTGHWVLIGAEVDKIFVILTVTGVLALTLVRAKRLLYGAVSSETTAKDLSRFVTQEVVDRVTHADSEIQPGSCEMRTASVLFTDIEGFSTIAEKITPPQLMSGLNDYFATLSDIIEAHEGVIDQYQGDALLVTFNASRPDADHARHALEVALAIQETVAERRFGDRNLRFLTRCGINTGEVVVGAFGSRDRLLFTVHGDEVNVAARLEQMNKQYGTYVLATESTLTAAGNGFHVAPKGEVTVKGRSAPTQFSAVTREK